MRRQENGPTIPIIFSAFSKTNCFKNKITIEYLILKPGNDQQLIIMTRFLAEVTVYYTGIRYDIAN